MIVLSNAATGVIVSFSTHNRWANCESLQHADCLQVQLNGSVLCHSEYSNVGCFSGDG